MPGRAIAEHRAHALPHPRHRIFGPRPFMIILRPAGHVRVEGKAQVWGGIVPADSLVRGVCGCHFGQQLAVAVDDSWEIHHFAQPDDPGPGHGLCHFLRSNGRARRFKTRR